MLNRLINRHLQSILIFASLLSACAPASQVPKSGLSPRQRAAGAPNIGAAPNLGGTPTATADSSPTKTARDGTHILPEKLASPLNIGPQTKCRITNTTTVDKNTEASAEVLCPAIWVTLNSPEKGDFTLKQLVDFENVNLDPYTFKTSTDEDVVTPKTLANGTSTQSISLSYNSTITDTKDNTGKFNRLQLAFVLPDSAEAIDLSTLMVSWSDDCHNGLKILETTKDRRDDPLLYKIQNENNKTVLHILLGQPDALQNLNYHLSISYDLKPSAQKP